MLFPSLAPWKLIVREIQKCSESGTLRFAASVPLLRRALDDFSRRVKRCIPTSRSAVTQNAPQVPLNRSRAAASATIPNLNSLF
ncbi:uncharacterized protein BDZ83DRAFT_617750 [Colletotrichum acutatum]|uniref:Uncharacterized protein n=1 Tax=Glomerella acutata TaxID=27357 RepID=A0AAD8URJ8_GLOAC|nr:uncharacterized protein BDZ83DRAFT_617750 [Colletotrichum acutatum]KAK1726041.1 hypothetical protein BDZ83DRAFT_617750 [Colletotrichum acutatum]